MNDSRRDSQSCGEAMVSRAARPSGWANRNVGASRARGDFRDGNVHVVPRSRQANKSVLPSPRAKIFGAQKGRSVPVAEAMSSGGQTEVSVGR